MAMDVPKLYVKFSIWLTECTDTLSTVYHNVNTQTTSWNQATFVVQNVCTMVLCKSGIICNIQQVWTHQSGILYTAFSTLGLLYSLPASSLCPCFNFLLPLVWFLLIHTIQSSKHHISSIPVSISKLYG